MMAWYDYLYTGDTRLLEARYELLQNHTLADLRQPNGLVSTRVQPQSQEFLQGIRRTQPIRDIVDWPEPERDGYEFGTYNLVPNCWQYMSLTRSAELALLLGKDQDAADFRQAAARLRRTIRCNLRTCRSLRRSPCGP